MNEEYIKALWDNINGDEADLGDFETFRNKLSNNRAYRQNFYDHFGGGVLGEREKFEQLVAIPDGGLFDRTVFDQPKKKATREPEGSSFVDTSLGLFGPPEDGGSESSKEERAFNPFEQKKKEAKKEKPFIKKLEEEHPEWFKVDNTEFYKTHLTPEEEAVYREYEREVLNNPEYQDAIKNAEKDVLEELENDSRLNDDLSSIERVYKNMAEKGYNDPSQLYKALTNEETPILRSDSKKTLSQIAANVLKANPDVSPSELTKKIKEQYAQEKAYLARLEFSDEFAKSKQSNGALTFFATDDEREKTAKIIENAINKLRKRTNSFSETAIKGKDLATKIDRMRMKFGDDLKLADFDEIDEYNKAISDLKKIQQDLESNYENIDRDFERLGNFSQELDSMKRDYNLINSLGLKLFASGSELLASGLGDVAMVGDLAGWDSPGVVGDWLNEKGRDLRNGSRRSMSYEDIKDWKDFAEYSGDVFANQLPQIGVLMATRGKGSSVWNKYLKGPAILGGLASGGKYLDIRNRDDLSKAQIYAASGLVGLKEFGTEIVTSYIFNKAFPGKRVLRSMDDVTKTKAKDFLKENFKTSFKEYIKKGTAPLVSGVEEGASELLAQLAENGIDKYVLGDDVSMSRGLTDAMLTGAIMGAGLRAAPGLMSEIASPFIGKSQRSVLRENTEKINALLARLNTVKDEKEKTQIELAIDILETQNVAVLGAFEEEVDKYSEEDRRKLIENSLRVMSLKTQYSKIQNDDTLSEAEKTQQLEGIEAEYNILIEERNAVQEQSTDEVPVQPDATVSEEVEEGVPETKPEELTEQEEKELESLEFEEATTEDDIEYRSELVEKSRKNAPAEAEVVSISRDDSGNVIAGEIEFIQDGETVTEKIRLAPTEQGTRTPIEGTKLRDNIKKAIAKVFTKTDSRSFKNGKEMSEYAKEKYGQDIGQDEGARVFINQDGSIEILVNEELSDDTSFGHEVWHPILLKAFGDNQKKFTAFRKSINNTLRNNGYAELADNLDDFANQYKETEVLAEEYLAQLGGILTAANIDVANLTEADKTLLQQIKEIVNKIMVELTGQPVFLEDATPKDILNFMSTMSDMMARGEDISGLFKKGSEARSSSRAQKQAIKILDGPKFDKKKKEDVATYLNGLRESVIPPDSSREDLISRFINNVYEEVGYYLYSKKGPRDAGLTWYIEDMVEFGNKVKVILPELQDENQYKLFLSILAITSSGTNPNQNLLYAYNLWNNSNNPSEFDLSKTWGDMKMSFIDKKGKSIGNGTIQKETSTQYVVELVDSLGRPIKDKKGNSKTITVKKNNLKEGYPKSTGYTNRGEIVISQLEKLQKLYKELGSIEEVVNWLQSPQSIADLRQYNMSVPDINGKSAGKTNKQYDPKKNAEGKRNGAFILGEKIGSFYQNMIGIGETITMDLWWSRTWNRYMGTMISTVKGKQVIQETPRTDRERNIMRDAVTMVAEDLNLDVSELQAAIWYFEQELWTNSGNASPSYSYVTAIEDLTNKLKVDEQTRTKLREAEADLTEAEKRRKIAAERAAAFVSDKGVKKEVKTRAQKWPTSLTQEQVDEKLKEAGIRTKTENDRFLEDEGKGNETQRNNIKTYDTFVGGILNSFGDDVRILDIGAGFGIGAMAAKKQDVADIYKTYEPFPSLSDGKWEKFSGTKKPNYTKESQVPKDSADVIVSNAVLNVVPQDIRDGIVNLIGDSLAPGGKAYISVRGIKEEALAKALKNSKEGKGKNVFLSETEYYVPGVQGDYQKGFSPEELKAYVQDTLGNEYTVEVSKESFWKNSSSAPKVVVSKKGEGVLTRAQKARAQMSPMDFSSKMEKKYGIELDLMGSLEKKPLTLGRIIIPKGKRSQGIGRKVMQEIVKYADENNKRIVLTPSKDFGATSISRLVDFYKEFGFVENKGANKDFTTKESMYRDTTTTRAQKKASPERMQKELDGVIEKARKRGADKQRVYDDALAYLQGSKVYEEADDVAREKMVRDLNKKLGVKEKRVPKIFATRKNTDKVTVNEKKALLDMIRAQAKAAKTAVAAQRGIAKALNDELKMLFKKGFISTRQMKAIINKALSLNFFNDDHVVKFVEYVEKVYNNAEYAENLKNAESIKRKIKRFTKNKDLQAETRDIAKRFLEIEPFFAENIEEYLKIANQILEATSTTVGKVVEGEATVNFKQAMDYGVVTEYTDKALAFQEEAKKKQLMNKNAQLVESGVLDEEMSLEEMKLVVQAIEENPDMEGAAEKKKMIKDFVRKYYDSYKALINEMIRTQSDPFTGERIFLTREQIKLVERFLGIDIETLNLKDAFKIIESIDNFIVNQNTDGMLGSVEAFEGGENAKLAKKLGFKARRLRLFFSKKFGGVWAEQFEQLTLLTNRMFGGESAGAKWDKLSGLSDLMAVKNKAFSRYNKYVENYSKQFENIKDFNSLENIFARAMLAYVSRASQGSKIQQDAEFTKRKKNIEKSIAILKKRGKDRQKKDAKVLEKVYKELLEDANTAQEVSSRSSKTNRLAVSYWQAAFSDIFDDMQRVSRGVYNTILERDFKYTPDTYSRVGKKLDDQESIEEGINSSAFFGINDNFDTKESGSMMQATKPQLTEDSARVVSFDFDSNVARALQAAIMDIETAPLIRKIDAFYNSKEVSDIVEEEDLEVLRNRVAGYIRATKRKEFSRASKLGDISKSLNYISTFGAAKALAGFSQIFKQTIPVMGNTLINSGGRTGLGDVLKAKGFIDNSGYAIGLRGIASQADIQTMNKILKRAEESSGMKALNYVRELNQLLLENLVAKPDVFVARASWLAYYKQNLAKQGLDTKIDWDTHELNKEAADYAQRKVDKQQNYSDADLAGDLLRSKDQNVALVRKSLFPFATFMLNKRSALIGDVSTLQNKLASKEDKKAAALSLMSNTAEMIMFHKISIFIGSTIYGALASALAGGDEEDEAKKEERRLKRKMYSVKNAVNEYISPIPGLTDEPIDLAINKLLDIVGIDEKYQLPEGRDEDIVSRIGMIGISASKLTRAYDLIEAATTGEINGKELSKEDKDTMRIIASIYGMYAMGSLPADLGSISEKAYYMITNKYKGRKKKKGWGMNKGSSKGWGKY